MEPIDLQVNESERNHMRLLESYKDAVANRLPHPCRDIVQRWSLKPRDALALIRFLQLPTRGGSGRNGHILGCIRV